MTYPSSYRSWRSYRLGSVMFAGALLAALSPWAASSARAADTRAQTSPDYQILVSTSATRSGAVPLNGSVLTPGHVYYPFVAPDSAIKDVVVLEKTGPLVSEEQVAPFDLTGTAANGNANPWNLGPTSTAPYVDDGPHDIVVDVNQTNGVAVQVKASFSIEATFDGPIVAAPTSRTAYEVSWPAVAGASRYDYECNTFGGDGQEIDTTRDAYTSATSVTLPAASSSDYPRTVSCTIDAATSPSGDPLAGAHEALVTLALPDPPVAGVLSYSTSPTRSNPQPLEGATVSGTIYVFSSRPGTFSFDDSTVHQVEQTAPYDFHGTAAGGTATAWNTANDTNGVHVINIDSALGGQPRPANAVDAGALFTIHNG